MSAAKPDPSKIADAAPAPSGKTRACPICGKPATEAAKPFCSKRCADVDLHRWLGGVYAIPAVDQDEGLADDDA